MKKVTQIKVGNNKIGLVDFEDTLKEVAETGTNMSDDEIASEMLERLTKKNYIHSGVYDKYGKAFIREYKKYIGEPVPEEPLEEIEIKVLGPGCASCDKLEMVLIEVLQEMDITADLEHVRDLKEIAAYGVMGSPALVINRKVKTVGTVPSKSKLEKFIRDAAAELDTKA